MCAPIAAIVPWLTGAAAVASVASALKPTPSIDIPPPPKVETPPPAPTVSEVSPRVKSVAGEARNQMKRQIAAASSWLSTKNTGALGLSDTASTKKSLLGGVAAPLGG